MSVLVTGGAGYIGSHMVHELLARKERVVVIDNLSTGFASAIPPDILMEGDIGEASVVECVIRSKKVESIIHFAGSVVVPESVREPLKYYKNNTDNSRTLIDVAIKCGVRQIIFSSTAAVYGNPESVPVTETAELAPVSPYGESKRQTENILRDVCRAHNFRHAILRYFNVAGADPQGRTGQSTKGATHLIKVAVETALGKRSKIDVFGTDYPTPDGTCVRDYIHVSDLVSAHVAALDYLRSGGSSTTLNCGYGRGFSVLEVIETVKRVSGVNFQVEFGPRREGDPAQIIAACEKIRNTLNWRPQWNDLSMIVGHALAWEKQLQVGGSIVRLKRA